MKLLAASLLSLGLGLAGVSASQAMPIAPIAPSQAEVIQVAQGCGPGFHRGPGGHCRRSLYRVETINKCPPGWRTGPYGSRCHPVRRY